MKLILIRHAIAEDREDFARSGEPDELRPLTADGKLRMKQTARGLREIVDDLDVLATSPLTRAVQTANIVARQYKNLPPAVVSSLAPGQEFEEFADWIKRLDDVQTVGAVGHEPHISALAAWFIAGSAQPFFEMKKGSAAMLEFSADVREGGAQLRWLLSPAQLRLIGD